MEYEQKHRQVNFIANPSPSQPGQEAGLAFRDMTDMEKVDYRYIRWVERIRGKKFEFDESPPGTPGRDLLRVRNDDPDLVGKTWEQIYPNCLKCFF